MSVMDVSSHNFLTYKLSAFSALTTSICEALEEYVERREKGGSQLLLFSNYFFPFAVPDLEVDIL